MVRLLSSASNGDVYVGFTNDLRHRFAEHSPGEVTSTKAYLPLVLKSYIAVPTETHARQLEVYFKSGSGKAFAKKRFFCPLPADASSLLPSKGPSY